MIGQDRLETLFDHVGKVEENDSFEAALRKVKTGIMGQTKQAVSRLKLFTKIGQGKKKLRKTSQMYKIYHVNIRGLKSKMVSLQLILDDV